MHQEDIWAEVAPSSSSSSSKPILHNHQVISRGRFRSHGWHCSQAGIAESHRDHLWIASDTQRQLQFKLSSPATLPPWTTSAERAASLSCQARNNWRACGGCSLLHTAAPLWPLDIPDITSQRLEGDRKEAIASSLPICCLAAFQFHPTADRILPGLGKGV